MVYFCVMSKAEKTKQFIIEKTAPIFNKKGYAGTSLSDITEATGLTKGSIYGNFKNKDEVAIESFKYNLNQIFEEINNEISVFNSSIDKLLGFIRALKKNARKTFQNGGCPILNTATEADDTHKTLKKVVLNAIETWKNSIEVTINEGKNNREIKNTIDARLYAGIIISLVEGAGMLTKITDDEQYYFDALDKLESIILNEMKQ